MRPSSSPCSRPSRWWHSSPGGDETVTVDASHVETGVGLIVAVALLGHLVLALLFPERF
ncbi:K(+)-transporting ATPase subunit F [Streptomyces dangxiongensis]|uniref:K(+)-transporting ATPase subunit F n=1 Tax=Streptomyces dangxiongensis TaxID=1442032 RepID=A0A3G2JBD4_9ACTN|nr:K(+)-transporting ATPase subunit F [Streptomyces dangxiongensis]